MKKSFMYILLLSILFVGCGSVDIRSARLKSIGLAEDQIRRGQRILQQAVWRQDVTGQWDRFDRWTIVARDVWKANFIRRFSPITQPDQRIEFTFYMKKDLAKMKYLEGKPLGKILGVENDMPFYYEDDERIVKKNTKITNYLAPTRDYFFWPQNLVNAEIIVYDGEESVNGQSYHKIFVTNGDFEVNELHDQYFVWINKDTMKIDYIEFTIRELMQSYRGVAQYLDYKEVKGMNLPHKIVLKERINTDKFSHKFIVEDMQFKKKKSALTLNLEIVPLENELPINL